MAKLNLRPQNFGTGYDVVEEIEGIVYKVLVGDPLTKTVTNYLENKKPVGFYILNKVGFGDVYFNNIAVDLSTFDIVRSVDIEISIVVY